MAKNHVLRVIVTHQHDPMYGGDCRDHCLPLSCSTLSVSHVASFICLGFFFHFPLSFPASSCFAASSSSVPFLFLFSSCFPLLIPLLPVLVLLIFYFPFSSSCCFYSFRSPSSTSHLVFSSTSFFLLLLFLHFLRLAFLLLIFFSFTVLVLYPAIYSAT